jgi:hypothetical protein
VTQEYPDDADPVGDGLDDVDDEDVVGDADEELEDVGVEDPVEEDAIVGAVDAESVDVGLDDGVEVSDPVGVGVLPLEAAAELPAEPPVGLSPTGRPHVGWQAATASTEQAATAIMVDFLFRGLKILPNFVVCTMIPNRNQSRASRLPKRPSSGKFNPKYD